MANAGGPGAKCYTAPHGLLHLVSDYTLGAIKFMVNTIIWSIQCIYGQRITTQQHSTHIMQYSLEQYIHGPKTLKKLQKQYIILLDKRKKGKITENIVRYIEFCGGRDKIHSQK